MNLTSKRVQDTDVVEVKGQVDVSSIPDLEAFLAEFDEPELVVDLTGVSFMDTTGVRFLLGLANRFTNENRSLRLVLKEESPVLLILKITGLSDQFIITDSGDMPKSETS